MGRNERVQRSIRWIMAGLVALVAATAADNADARSHHRRRHQSANASEGYQPPTASIVVDANSGAVLEEANADSLRHPASLSKIMTLYLLFERLDAGKVKMSTALPVSPHAAGQAPSKLGLKPGETIDVESAIRAIVTKSANDVAVVVAEALGGDENSFGRMMTAKAHALGMQRTTYHNASGLPDDLQITTARDQSILARAMQDRFPQYYHYFSTRSFEFRGAEMRNHNHLLGRIAGVDGMKTGYIRDSGFNIVTSVHRNNRRIVAVVFGGRTASARDARVVSLIDNNINIASVKRTTPPVLEGSVIAQARNIKSKPAAEQRQADAPIPIPVPRVQNQVASASENLVANAPEKTSADEALLGSNDPIKPNPVKTVAVHLSPAAQDLSSATPDKAASSTLPLLQSSTLASASVTPISPPLKPATAETTNAPVNTSAQIAASAQTAELTPAEPKPPGIKETEPSQPDQAIQTESKQVAAKQIEIKQPIETKLANEPAIPSPVKADSNPKQIEFPVKKAALKEDATAKDNVSITASVTETIAKAHTGWMIQIGAFDDEKEAKQRLVSAKTKAKTLLNKADPFTERISKGDKALYRARFAGLGKEQAQTVCKHLKRNEIPCMMLKN